jgi:hypothetical protein
MTPMSESVISKVGFWQGLVVAGISIIVTLATVFIAVGGLFQRVNQVEIDQKEIEQKYAGLDDRLRRIEEKMVDKEDFREMRRELQQYFSRK